MMEKIDDIRQAVKNKCYYSALALALTIPDIFGKISYDLQINPDTGKKYREHEKYIKWFNEYMYEPNRYRGEYEEHYKEVQFNGDACYMLRCSYLHNGVADIQSEDGKVRVNRFELAILDDNDDFSTFGASSGIITDGNGKILDRHIRVDIIGLCLHLCDEAERQYNETADKQVFYDHSVKILNLLEEIAKINEINRR